MIRLWKSLTSLRLTVVCLALSILLVFFGTLAQVNEGLWVAQERWFRSLLIWWGPAGASWKIPIFPGGYLVGGVLLLNLVASHVSRFQWSWRKLGIHLTHFGVVLLLLSELFTYIFSRESVLSFREGESRVYSQARTATELVFLSDSGAAQEKVVAVSGKLVAAKKEIAGGDVPFTVRVQRYQPNSEILSREVVTEAAGLLTTALATMEAQYSAPEGLPAQAERALESEGRIKVWREALAALGDNGKGDLLATAKAMAAEATRGPKLAAELKGRFRQAMLTRFSMQTRNGRATDEKTFAQGLLADRLLANQPITAESFPIVATRGVGPAAVVLDRPANTEMDKGNIPYAVVELLDNGQSLGTWLLSPPLPPQAVAAGERKFQMAFRFERYYQPFTLTLLKTSHEIYAGTQTAGNPEGIPKNFQSRVRIANQETGERREVDIFMNNPLRYGGETFYQYQMASAEVNGGGISSSTLLVVKNPSWLTPYLGCIIVGVGMLYQFGFHLFGFLGKRLAPGRAAEAAATPEKRRRADRKPAAVS